MWDSDGRDGLAVVPDGGALGEEGGEAFVLVGGAAEATEDVGLGGESFGEGLAFAAVDGFKEAGDGEGGHGGDGFGEGLGTGQEVSGWNDFVDEAETEGFGGIDDLSGEHHAEGGAGADEAGETLRAAVAGDEAEFELGEAEAGLVAGDAEGAGKGEFATTAEGDAVDGGEDWLAGTLKVGGDEREDMLAALGDGEAGEGVGVDEGANVGTSSEGAVAGASDDEDADGGVGGEGGEDALEFVEHLGVESMEDFGTIEGDGRNLTHLFEVQCFEVIQSGHGLRVLRGAGRSDWRESRSNVGTGANANR